MLKACKWIKDKEDQEDKPLSILILIDSESLTNALESRGWKAKDEWLKNIKNILATLQSDIRDRRMFRSSHIMLVYKFENLGNFRVRATPL